MRTELGRVVAVWLLLFFDLRGLLCSLQEGRDIHSAASAVHSFVLHDLCDVFIEFAKPSLKAADQAADQDLGLVLSTLFRTLEASLRLVHPFMPFITEVFYHYSMSVKLSGVLSPSQELWQRLRRFGSLQLQQGQQQGQKAAESIMVAPFPVSASGASEQKRVAAAAEAAEADAEVERAMQALLGVLRGYRSLKQSFAAHIGKQAVATMTVREAAKAQAQSLSLSQLLTSHLPALKHHCRTDRLELRVSNQPLEV